MHPLLPCPAWAHKAEQFSVSITTSINYNLLFAICPRCPPQPGCTSRSNSRHRQHQCHRPDPGNRQPRRAAGEHTLQRDGRAQSVPYARLARAAPLPGGLPQRGRRRAIAVSASFPASVVRGASRNSSTVRWPNTSTTVLGDADLQNIRDLLRETDKVLPEGQRAQPRRLAVAHCARQLASGGSPRSRYSQQQLRRSSVNRHPGHCQP